MLSCFNRRSKYVLLTCGIILLLVFQYISFYYWKNLSWKVSVSAVHVIGKNVSSFSPLWHNISNDTIMWYTAHYEHRHFAYKSPSAIVLMFFHYYKSPLPTLFIKLFTVTRNGDILKHRRCVKGEWLSFGHIVSMKGEVDYLHFAVFKLKADKSRIPNFIDLHVNSSIANSSIVKNIPVYYKDNEIQIMCATCLYRAVAPDKTIKTPDIASWIELNRALGIQHITMYDQSLTNDILKMLSKYRQEGFVELVDWKLHYEGHRIANGGQVGTIQDCFYRYLRKAKYVLFIDLDELIVPHKHTTIPQMIDYLNKKRSNNVTQYRFYNSFWHDDGKIVLGAEKYNIALPVHFRRTNRTLDCPSTIRHKNIVKMETAIRVGIHHVYDMKKGQTVYQVPENIGLMHHYRTPDYAYQEEQIQDMTMSKYVDQVMTRLHNNSTSI